MLPSGSTVRRVRLVFGGLLTDNEQRPAPTYWDQILAETRSGVPLHTWRAYMRRVYLRLMGNWPPAAGVGRGLKTDLHEEAITPHHLLLDLGPRSVGIDCSLAVVRSARERLAASGGHHLFVVGDLRCLPLRSGSMQCILSGSSLDHFPNKTDIATSVAELGRVLAPGGTLVVTFDNPHNPVVWLRNHLPFDWLHRLRLVPYYVGETYSRREAHSQLTAAGLTVTEVTAVSHAPRAPAIWLVKLVERIGWRLLEPLTARILDSFEVLESWPTRYQTGYYLALRAHKAMGPPQAVTSL